MGKSAGSSQRPVTAEERALWDSQKENLDVLTQISQDQYDLSVEDRNYYEEVFREGSDTEAKEAIAKLKGQITGETVDPASIESVNIDSLLRDTLLNASPEFQFAAADLVTKSQELTSKYGTEVTGLSESFAKSINDYTTNYSEELQTIKEQTGTINQDVLARETGAAQAGISTAFAESRKQMSSDLARRGISGSGIEANLLASNYQQEAMSKAQAGVQARSTALQQSEAIRQQQANIAGSQLQANTAGATTGYQATLGGIQNVYGVTSQADYQNYQTSQAATLQGMSALTQVAQAGTGLYAGSQNYLAQASQSAGNAANAATSAASAQATATNQYQSNQIAMRGQTLEMVGALAGGGMALASDERLKTNITFVENRNGHNIYTWDWIEGHDYGYNEGVIAQEVMETNPEAVVVMSNGYYAVNYSMLGV